MSWVNKKIGADNEIKTNFSVLVWLFVLLYFVFFEYLFFLFF